MILLIDDDNYSQMSINYPININNLIDNNNGKIEYWKLININDEAELEKKIKQYELVAIHNSYPDENIKDTVKEFCRINRIPLVVFSNQFKRPSENKVEGCTYSLELSKDRFYLNLMDFLESYQDDKLPNISRFIYGGNYKEERVKELKYKIVKKLIGKVAPQKYEEMIQEGTEIYILLKELFDFHTDNNGFLLFEDQLIEKGTLKGKDVIDFINSKITGL